MNDPLRTSYQDKFRNDNFNLSAQDKARIKENIFANLGAQDEIETPVSMWSNLSTLFLKSYVLVPLVILLFVSGTAVASAHALPGDPLYPLKRQVENAQLFLAPTSEAKLQLQIQYAQNRLDEAAQVSALQVDDSPIVSDSNTNLSDNINTNANDGQDNSSDSEKNAADLAILNGHKRRTERQVQAEAQATDAINFLNKAQKQYSDNGESEKAKSLQNQINKLRNRPSNKGSQEDDKKTDEQKGIPIPTPSSVTPASLPVPQSQSTTQVTPHVLVPVPHVNTPGTGSISTELKF